MSFLTTIISPKKGEEIDPCFHRITTETLESLPDEDYSILQKGHHRIKDFQKEMESSVQRLGTIFLETTRRLEPEKLDTARKHLLEICNEFGYFGRRGSEMVGSITLHDRLLTKGHEMSDWFASLPLTSRYELSRCSNEGIVKVWEVESDKGSLPVSTAKIRQIKSIFPSETTHRGGSFRPQQRTHRPSLPPQQSRPDPVPQVLPSPAESQTITIQSEVVEDEETLTTNLTDYSPVITECDQLAKSVRSFVRNYQNSSPDDKRMMKTQVENILRLMSSLERSNQMI